MITLVASTAENVSHPSAVCPPSNAVVSRAIYCMQRAAIFVQSLQAFQCDQNYEQPLHICIFSTTLESLQLSIAQKIAAHCMPCNNTAHETMVDVLKQGTAPDAASTRFFTSVEGPTH